MFDVKRSKFWIVLNDLTYKLHGHFRIDFLCLFAPLRLIFEIKSVNTDNSRAGFEILNNRISCKTSIYYWI